jgi:ABC-type protease/lipase transport system fused ATPase/permease subunit
MRTGRAATADLLRQGRRALAVAGGLGGLAAVLWLALPLFVWHAVDAALGQTPIDALLPLGVLVLGLLGVRLVLIEVRDRIVLRTGLWFQHMAGRALLQEGLTHERARPILLDDQHALRRLAAAATAPAAAARLDASLVALPLILLTAIAPLLGLLVGTTTVMAGLLILRARRQLAAVLPKVAHAETAADDAWRLLAHNAAMLSRSGLADGMQNDWSGLSAAALGHHYRQGLTTLRRQRGLRAALLVALLGTAGLGASLVLANALSLGAFAAALLLVQRIEANLTAAHDHVATQVAADQAMRLLSSPIAPVAAPVARPAPAVTAPQAPGPVARAGA